MSKSLLILMLCLVAVGFSTTRMFISPQDKDKQTAPSKRSDLDATIVQGGDLTPRQKEHSKLYRRSGSSGNLIEAPQKQSKKHKEMVQFVFTDPLAKPDAVPEEADLFSYLVKASCKADAVVVANVKSKASQLTEDNSFVFTDYEIQVEEVIKDNRYSHIQANDKVILTSGGGNVKVGTQIISVEDESSPQYEQKISYVLFLKFIPATGAYQPITGANTFSLLNNQVSFGSPQNSVFQKQQLVNLIGESRDASTFLVSLRNATARTCNEERRSR